MNTQTLEDRMMLMEPADLQKFAAMHKNDPYVLPLALKISDMRNKLKVAEGMKYAGVKQPTIADRAIANINPQQAPQQAVPQQALPEETGIAPLAAPNIEGMADGGIAGYAGGPDEPRGVTDTAKYREYAIKKAQALGLNTRFVDSLFRVESSTKKHPEGYDPNAKSKTGPVGIGQLTKATAAAYGLKPEDRYDPYKNIDASLAHLADLTKKYQGDERKVAVAYNQGEGYLNTHLRQNKGKLVPEALDKTEPRKYIERIESLSKGKEPSIARNLFESMIPSAQASELEMSRAPVAKSGLQQLPNISDRAPAPVPVSAADSASQRGNTLSGKVGVPVTRAPDEQFVSQASQIPGAVEQPARAPEENKLLRAGKDVLGAPEALLSMGTSAFAPFTHLLPRGIAAISGQPISQEEAVNAVTYAPRLDVSKGSLESAGRAFEDLKIPPFMPGVGGPRSQRVGPAMEAEAAAARAAAEAAAGKVENVRLPPTVKSARPAAPPIAIERPAAPEFPLSDSALEGQRLAQAGRERQAVQNLARDKNEAQIAERKAVGAGENAKSAKLLDEMLNARALEDAKRNRSFGDISRASGAANIAKRSTVPPGERPYEAFEEGFTAPETNYRKPVETFPAPTAEQAAAAPATAAEVKKGFNLSDEDWLNLGLGLLSGGPREGNALQDLMAKTGKAGISALAARKEREKAKEESEFKKLMGKYYQDIGAAQSRPGETERIVQQIAKDEGVPFSEAFRMFKDMSYGAGSLSPALLLKEYEKNSKDIMMGDMFRSQYPTFEAYMQSRQGAVSGNPAQIDPNIANEFKIVGSRPTQ